MKIPVLHRFGKLKKRGALAQLGERGLCKPEVRGSIPLSSTTNVTGQGTNRSWLFYLRDLNSDRKTSRGSMKRTEAFRILGLEDDASSEDIKAAYKEMAQILHPDRFASSKKLQDRATEQFKNLQEAYDVLQKPDKKSKGQKARTQKTSYSEEDQYEARLAGIAAARTQLVAQRDTLLDERRSSFMMLGLGLLVALFLRRIPIALAFGTTTIVWGIVRLASSYSTVKNLDEHITKLNHEQKKILEALDDL